MWAALALFVVLASALLGCAAPHSPHFVLDEPEERLSLEGEWRFREGDDARYADPTFDDHDWRTIQIPGIWRFQGVKTDDFGWYRQGFDLGPALDGQDLGLEVPYTYYAYEVFVNGTKLDGRYDTPSRRGVMPAGSVNAFRVPKGVLKRTGNIIALRTQGGMGYGGVYRDGMSIGTFGVISRALDREIVVQLGVSAVCMFIGVYHLLIFLNRRENRLAYLSYSAYAIILSIFLPAYSGFWYVVFPSHWFNTLAEFGTFAASIPFIPIFIHALFDVPQNRITRGTAIFTGLTLTWLLGEAAVRGTISSFLVFFPLVVVGFTVSFVYSLSIVVRAARLKKPDALLLLLGFVWYLVCTTNDVARYFVLLPGGTRLGHWGFLGFCVAIAIGIGNQYSRMTRNLAALRVGLEEEVEQQTKELRAKNSQLSEQAEELRSLDEMKRRFYTNVSHELRTPLTLILGFLRRLRARVTGDAAATGDMDAAVRNAAHLLREINDLLDVARLEAGSMTVRAAPVDLAALATEVASNFAPAGQAAGSGRKLVVEAKAVLVYIDFDKVRKIVFNLLSNAFKFTDDEHGVVTLTVREEGDGVLLEVADNGVGIRADQLAHVFERFRQADGSTTRKYEGTGIGLALVKEIAELHGAAASVTSEYGKGSAFRILFKKGRAHLRDEDVSDTAEATTTQPSDREADAISDLQKLAAAPAPAPSGRPSASAPQGAPEILVVEDHRDLRAYMVSLLGGTYRVRSAGDGKEALARIEERAPALVVSDVMMPNMDGYELCAALKSNPRTRHIPIVLLTAQAGVEAKVRGLEAQADDYLTKPFHEEELFARVKNLLLLAERTNELFEINKKLEVRVLEQADALQRRGRLRRFLPPSIADELLAEDAGAALEKKRRLVSVLSAEICEFDDLAAALEPEDVTVLFGRFHALTTAAVFRNGGTIVALHNGSVVAVFGAPKEMTEQDASEAGFKAAREISAALDELDLAMSDLAADRHLALRGGLDVGHATVGAFGDNEWASFAAIGGPSARAPRLTALAGPGEIVLTRRLASQIGDAAASLLGPETVHLEETSQLIFRWRGAKQRAAAATVRRAAPDAQTVQAISVRPHDPTREIAGTNGSGDTMRSLVNGSAALKEKKVAVTNGRTLGGRYKIEEQLGRGGMGSVYAASDLLLGERVAIKVLHDDDTDADDAKRRLERLRHEVRLARLVTHPNVCRVFDLQVLDGHACLTMELLRGRSLRELLDSGSVDTQHAIAWTKQICEALGAAHACGIVHRDLKPDNVMVDVERAAPPSLEAAPSVFPEGTPTSRAPERPARTSGLERVVITDFGIARPLPQPDGAEGASSTQKSPELRPALEGTLDYIAPEQLDPAATPDHRADIYALGVVLYELFTGALPFDDKQALARLRARLVREPRDPAALIPSIDPTIRAVLLRCLRRDVSERFQRVADIANALGG